MQRYDFIFVTRSEQFIHVNNHNKRLIISKSIFVMEDPETQQLRLSMANQQLIRNVSIVGEQACGKSSIFHRLTNIYPQQTKNQQQYCSTLKAKHTSVCWKSSEKLFLINLFDTPGHPQFLSDVSVSLRISDGCVFIVDATQELSRHSQIILKQSLKERVKPILLINQIDKLILDQQINGQIIYDWLQRIIDTTNVNIEMNQSQQMMPLIDVSADNIIFGCAKDGWGFNLRKFAKIYLKKFGVSQEKMLSKLWGDNYFDRKQKKWRVNSTNQLGIKLKRVFNQFVLDPIRRLCKAVIEGNSQISNKMLQLLQIKITEQEGMLTGRDLLDLVLCKWMPIEESLKEVIINKVPSPQSTQQYKIPYLYEQSNYLSDYMKKCDPKGPLIIYISRMIPSEQKGQFFALGRIFSGTLKVKQVVKILGTGFKAKKKEDLFQRPIQSISVNFDGTLKSFSEVPSGNIVLISHIDKYIIKSGAIYAVQTSLEQLFPFRAIKHSPPIFKMHLRPKNAVQIDSFNVGFKRLQRYDPLIICQIQQTGQYTICGSGELHIQTCIKALKDYAECEIVQSLPFVSYRQTITNESSQVVMVKSQNRHNRLYGSSLPLQQNFIQYIESSEQFLQKDNKIRSKRLVQDFNWDKMDAGRIWCFGPSQCGPNLLVDTTKGIQYLYQIKESMIVSFQWASKQGVLCDQPMRGIRFNLVDCQIRSDAIHRGGGQILPASRRLYYGLQLLSEPSLLQPIFILSITAPVQVEGDIYSCLNTRRGQVFQIVPSLGTNLQTINCFLPVAQSFGFTSLIKQKTLGRAVSRQWFDHWELIKGLPFVDQSAKRIVSNVRKMKGLKQELPIVDHYIDKL